MGHPKEKKEYPAYDKVCISCRLNNYDVRVCKQGRLNSGGSLTIAESHMQRSLCMVLRTIYHILIVTVNFVSQVAGKCSDTVEPLTKEVLKQQNPILFDGLEKT